MRRFFFICSDCVAITLLVLLHPYFNGKNKLISYYHHLVWGDVLRVSVGDGLDERKVIIIFKNEHQLIKERNFIEYYSQEIREKKACPDCHVINTVIFKDGEQVNDIPYDYGPQVLQVLYDGIEVGRLTHWQTNDYYSHRYYISLSLRNDSVFYSGYFKGPDVWSLLSRSH